MKSIRNTKAPTETQKEHKAKGRERDKQNEEKGHGSGTSIASLQALLSIASSLEIFHSFKSLLTDSSQVSLGLPLPLPFEIIRQAISWSFIWVSFVEFHIEWIVVSG